MRVTLTAAALLGVVTLGGCSDLDITDLNNPGLEQFQSSPTVSALNTATSGILISARAATAGTTGYITELGVFGREVYVLSSDDPRFVQELLAGPLDGGNGAFGGAHWAPRYASIRNSNIVLNAVEIVSGLTAQQKDGIRGFAKTLQALDLLLVVNTRDAFGAPIDVNTEPTAEPAPIVAKAEVFSRVVSLLEGARTHLQNAGTEFSFGLSEGFAGFDTPSTFLRFNRALRARVAIYLNDFATAQTALQQSFLDTNGSLTLGTYHTYSTRAGDVLNLSFDPTGRSIRGHPSFVANAQRKAAGSPDDRAAKNATAPNVLTVQNISSDKLVTRYSSASDPVPIIRNEELILLRAEASLGQGNIAAAVADINVIRTRAGGLAPYSGALTASAVLDELLYNRRYSLYYEGHRWIDLRRHNRLSTLPRDLPTHRVFTAFPFPADECLARTPQPSAGCTPVPGTP
ncbi:MAG: RagB/SusD family nutrient uptake outer membrane protein [Gemmatimonadaceae bacterium]